MANLTHAQLLNLVGLTVEKSAAHHSYTHLETDSRKMDAQGVFFALPGVTSDGWLYLDKVAELGGRVAVVPEDLGLTHDRLELLHVKDPAAFLVVCLYRFFGVPPGALVAVTGTNGKSSICFYLAQLAQSVGYASGLIGTFGVGPIDALQTASQTTPDLLSLHRLLIDMAHSKIDMAHSKIDFVAFEASSHALDQGRLYGVPFQTAVFSNLSRDHLDYHGSMDAYAAAKRRLFSFPSVTRGVFCLDDPYASFMHEGLSSDCEHFYYSEANAQADFYTKQLQLTPAGCQFILCHPDGEDAVFLPLLGRFNIQNALAALASLWATSSNKPALVAALASLQGAPGRMEKVSSSKGPAVVVDYAHTPDALKVALQALKEHSQGRLVCVFGCGGDRDKGKRPLMLQAALHHADSVWLTSDNPRTEAPQSIIDDALVGAPESEVNVEVDRALAISKAISTAQLGDIILIAGKGHETYQDINGVKHHFDDKEEALKVLTNYVA
ncbi:UDP-N-acetylmuramoyl-L-alanyl-D-glutamate--2,6-diaminopimelate ligase [Marinomonas pollencensis]|uniref:UDP-N-acetylmuramoyl-L-alanyl-D-glutamate--2,6-diaminopimelate ligase n=1 Tax=Marinomonas pollencensis TaxID=491954 RepID=A0A3E0DGD4_9GAMM|nr:UDP-N-acetylmuramoyl-L-alanyl-D-glutamate--2,6-diaminopimelate ligase [Marinomonas pollencensis]REG81640.1 UDP-N-acetylmuramoylalanyl-D-glutamate--2,6-diaminopimelate ligase [Marinomonas pollencensis]